VYSSQNSPGTDSELLAAGGCLWTHAFDPEAVVQRGVDAVGSRDPDGAARFVPDQSKIILFYEKKIIRYYFQRN
jgi:hypothetical protein